MFKIENYVTPIILNYVAKYVKNIRPQDAQLSLWEGEVVFFNLDLRLDVLESELNLPFEFLSGHIHELSIRVPWTKITSEPIRIDINTIEFVLKLKDDRDGIGSSANSPQRQQSIDGKNRRGNKYEDQSQTQPTSHGSGLVNKIINNIVIQCHNIILKYVEEDIVVSMNVQLLSFGSADEQWKPAMVDVHPLKVFMRKLIQISDLTICLDKRNAAGQIDVCQEPLLYRCTLECRILRKYNMQSMATTSTTRIGILTKSLDMNVSALQFPMAMRLFKLIMTLKSGDLKNTKVASDALDTDVDESESSAQSEGSYLSWAWNLLPSFNFQSAEEEHQAVSEPIGHSFDMGVYVEQLNFTLKNAEFVIDSIMGTTKRIRYTPIVRVAMSGMYFESISVSEHNWSCMKAGISSITVEPLGTYRCDEKLSHAILETISFENIQSFMDKSLFDVQYLISDKSWGVSNYEEYKTYITDEYLLYRSPVLAIDIIEYNAAKPETTESIDKSLHDNHVEYRVLSSGFTFRHCEAFLQVKHVIYEFISSYDYPAYHADRLDPVGTSTSSFRLHPPLMEDYDALMQHISLRKYKFDLKNICIELYAKIEQPITQKTQRRISVSYKHALPFLQVHLEQAEGLVSTPMNPDKLVHTTCQLPDKPNALLNACYNNYEFNVKELTVSLVKIGFDESHARLLSIPKLQFSYGVLLQPELWKSEEIAVKKLDGSCEKLIIDVTKKDMIATKRLISCILNYRHRLLSKLVRQIAIKHQIDSPRLQTEFNNFHVQQRCYKQHDIWNVCLRALQAFVVIRRSLEEIKHVLFTSLSKIHNNQQKWLEWQGQFPIGGSDLKVTMGLWMERFHLFMDSTLIEFLQYQEEPDTLSRETLNEVEIQTQIFQTPSVQQSFVTQHSNTSSVRRTSRHSLPIRKVSHPEETIHFSSERDDKVDVEALKTSDSDSIDDNSQMSWIKYVQSLIFLVEIGQGKLNIAKTFRRASNIQILSEFTEVLLPKIACRSTHAEYISRSNMWQKIAAPPSFTLNWKLSLNDLGIQNHTLYSTETILEPIQTTIIIALTHKKEKMKSMQKQHFEVMKEKKSVKKKNVQDSHTINDNKSRETRNTGSDDVGSVSADGRTNSMDDGEFDSNDGVSASPTKNDDGKEMSDVAKKQTSAQKNIVTLTLHADTTSINFFVSSEKVKIMHDHLSIVLSVVQLFHTVGTSIEVKTVDPVHILTSTEENITLKEFLDLESNSETSKITEDKNDALFVASFFCQWTVTKITIELETGEQLHKSKMVMELEDLLSTVDKHEDFSKYTSKMGNFSLNYYKPNVKGEWEAQECLRVKMFTETANLPFFNIIYTCVGLKSFYSKIGAKRKCELGRTISEVVITMQAIEVIIDLDKMVNFVVPCCVLFQKNKSIDSKSKSNVQCAGLLSTADLPLLHLDCKGFTLYMPLATEKKICSVLIWKLEGIKITPSLDNPLQRNPLRPDVYSKAAQMGILSTPGALVEDRQYELTLRNISAATGNWDEIVAHMREQANNFHRTNPAFEWNNQNRKTALQLTELFNNFKFIAIYAPSMVYNNILICGQALEFNCASDFIANINTFQLQLLCNLIMRFNNITRIINECYNFKNNISNKNSSISENILSVPQNSQVLPMQPLKRQSKSFSTFYAIKSQEYRSTHMFDIRASSSVFDSIDEDTEHNFKTDSGFQSHNSRLPSSQRIHKKDRLASISSNSSWLAERNEISCDTTIRHAPHTVSLVAGVFIIKIFDVPCNKEQNMQTNYKPLFAFTITQPSFMSTQSIYDSTMQVSLFNLNIHMGSVINEPIQQSPTTNLFPESLLETRTGELSPTGIPPPLFSFKAHRTKKQLLEIDIEMQRPVLIMITEDYAEQLCKNALVIYDTLSENSLFSVRSEQIIVRGSKIRLIRQQVFQADRLHVKFKHITVKFTNDISYNCKIFCSDIKLNMKFLNRPEKATVKGSVGAIYMQTENKIFVHPVTLRYSFDFISEPWHRLPLIIGAIKLNVLRLDVSISALLQLREALQGFNKINANINTQWLQFLRDHQSDYFDLYQCAQLTALKCPKLGVRDHKNSKTNKLHREEFYQDDLRAGAFQFVELMTDSFLPLPYQIQIIKKNYGIICWRYPQPRKMCKIHIYPVPMAVANPVRIKCRMEYFSEVHESFQHYSDFWLSETVSKQIALPEMAICANIWRVVILQSVLSVNGESFDSSEEGDDLRSISSTTIDEVLKGERKETDFILHPKVLVGCMRIDTAFQSDCVPKVQFLVSSNLIQVKLLNQPTENVELPSLLKKFKLAHVSPISQTFMEFILERTSVNSSFFTWNNYIIDSSTNCQIRCLDYGFLNMLYVLEPTTFQSYVCVDQTKRMMTVNIVLDRIRLNLGPTIVHSLLSSKMHWDELLQQENVLKRHALIPKCIVVNRTMSQMSFGQTGTTERIHLQPKECHLYSFRSDYHNQELTFFVADEESRITEVSQSVPVPFKYEGDVMLQTIRIGNKCIIIKSKRLSATQIYVLIKGQIELVSMVAHDLRVEFRREGKQSGEKHIQEYAIEANGRCSYYRSVHQNSNIVMRLKFANQRGKGRSGDIPLRANKNLPWLVKVPTHNNNNFVSLWVRIVREDIPEASCDKFSPQKVLITIWPIFMLNSMLSNLVHVVENSTNNSIDLKPQGYRYPLGVPATHLTEHKLDFLYNFPTNDTSLKNYTLTLKTIDWNTFFWYDEQKWNIEYALQELSKGMRPKWPLADEEEIRVKRQCNTMAKTDVQFKCMPSRDFSCTLSLEVSPWGIFINATGLKIAICDCETNDRISIDSNFISTIFYINKCFTINIENGSNWIASLPIYCNLLMPEHKSGRYLLLTDNSFVDIVLLRDNQILKFVLELKVESERKIFKLRSKFVVANFAKSKLCILPFAMDHKESVTREDVIKYDKLIPQKCDLEPVIHVENSIGLSLDYFYDLNSKKATRTIDTAFVCFACIKVCADSYVSIPIPLSLPFTRRCFSIQNGQESMPLLVTLTEKDNIYYLNIFDDVSPGIFINNQTDVQFIVAQTTASENSKVTNTTPEYEGRHFEWFQILPAQSKCYYTPPEMYANFPDVESTMCNLTFALFEEDAAKKNIKWSKPIRTDKAWEKFLHVPNHGDVKITICDKHRVIKVSIYYIAQQLEFSVKDLRSRLLTPATSSDNSSSYTVIKEEFTKNQDVQLSSTPPCVHFQQECEMKMQVKLRAYAKEFMFSLHTDAKDRDYMKCEIFSMYMDDVIFAYDDDEDRRQMNLLIANLQLDNQLYPTGKYDFPVVLCSQELYTRTVSVPQVYYLEQTYQELCNRQPMILLTLTFFVDELKIDSIACKLSPLRAYIEDAYLNDLFEALLECEPFNCVYKPKQENLPIVLSQGQVLLPRDVVAESCCIAEPLQLRSFRIEPLTVLLSVHTSVRLYIALDHSPLSFSTYERQRVLTMPLRFGQSVGMHFLSGAIFGAGWVVGSLEILGSPSGLARSFSTGLRDFVSMPMQGLFRGPWGFIVGITQGSASLLRNVTAGTVNSVTKLAASVARNLDRLTLDQEHIERTEALRRSRPRGFTEGFSQGITGLGISILGAVGGIAHHTLEARSPVEVVTGMGKGLVGAFTKPLSGAAELLALAGQGMLHTVGFNAMPQQRSPSVSNNIAVGPSGYRIWKLLPSELISDQILFHHEVTLSTQNQLRRGYVFLTSAVFALLEAQWDRLALVLPVKKVEMSCDRDDKTLIHVRVTKETDDIEEDLSYTNQRIMSFLRSSFSVVGLSAMTTDSLDDLLQTQTNPGQVQDHSRGMEWSFYINEQFGEHLIQYLSIINHQHHQC